MDKGFRGVLAVAVTVAAADEDTLRRLERQARTWLQIATQESGAFMALDASSLLTLAPETETERAARLAWVDSETESERARIAWVESMRARGLYCAMDEDANPF